jgi:hypothetical protein
LKVLKTTIITDAMSLAPGEIAKLKRGKMVATTIQAPMVFENQIILLSNEDIVSQLETN